MENSKLYENMHQQKFPTIWYTEELCDTQEYQTTGSHILMACWQALSCDLGALLGADLKICLFYVHGSSWTRAVCEDQRLCIHGLQFKPGIGGSDFLTWW